MQIGHCTHRVFRCVSKHMKFGFVPLSVEVSSINTSFSLNLKLLFPIRISSTSPDSASLSQCCPFLDAFQESSIVKTERSKQSDRVKYWRYHWKIHSRGYRCFNFFVRTSVHLKISPVTVHCSPSTEDPSVLGSTSTCFLLQIDFMSSGFTLVPASLLYIHFFSSNPGCERRGSNWLKTSIASSWVSTDLMRSFM